MSSFTNDYMDKVPLDTIIYSNFIRYEKMKELTLYQYRDSDSNNLNVFIDMESVLRPLYKRAVINNTPLYVTILNLCAHIREYYWTRHQVSTTIFIVDTDNRTRMIRQDDLSINIPNQQRDSIITMSKNKLRMLVPYFPKLYYIEGHVESAILIKNIIDKRLNYNHNMVLTKDLLCWQLPSLDPTTCIFRPRKSKAEDTSFVVNHSNCVNMWIQFINSSKNEISFNRSPLLFSLYIAMTNFREKTLTAYFSPKDAINRIGGLIDSYQILNGYNSPESIRDLLESMSIKTDKDNLYERYKSIDLQRLTDIYRTQPCAHDMSWCFSKSDIQSIKSINDNFHIEQPINIIQLYHC